MTSKWNTILSRSEIEARYTLTAKLDPAFAASERKFYETRTAIQLSILATEAWNCCEADAYQMARSYEALMQTERKAA